MASTNTDEPSAGQTRPSAEKPHRSEPSGGPRGSERPFEDESVLGTFSFGEDPGVVEELDGLENDERPSGSEDAREDIVARREP